MCTGILGGRPAEGDGFADALALADGEVSGGGALTRLGVPSEGAGAADAEADVSVALTWIGSLGGAASLPHASCESPRPTSAAPCVRRARRLRRWLRMVEPRIAYDSDRMKGIDGFFSEDEGRWYARFARALRGGTFVEIGSWKGRSTSFIGPICNGNATRLVCVDHWAGSHDSLAARYSAELAASDVQETFRANMRELGIVVEVIAEPSTVAALQFTSGSVDRVFLDGSHDGPSVSEDLRVWSARLREGGILAGHDYDAKHPDLCAAVDAFAAARALTVRRGPRSIFWLA